MNQPSREMIIAELTIVIAIATVLTIANLVLFIRYACLSKRKGALTMLGTWLFAAAVSFWRALIVPRSPFPAEESPKWILLIATALFVGFSAPFAIRLYQKWVGGLMTPEEKAEGRTGIQAWLSPLNLFVGGVVALSAWQVFDLPLVLTASAVLALLLVVPMKKMAAGVVATPLEVPPDPLASEREKVLSLLETGKITAEESADLLNALGAAGGAHVRTTAPLSSARRLALVGAALVLLGFLLPWFAFSPNAEMSRMMGSFQNQMPMPAMPMTMPDMGTVRVTGAEISKGLGWLIMGLALFAASFPLLARTLDRATVHLISLLGLGVGSIILLSTVTGNLRHVSIGAIIVIAGYAIEWLGVWRDDRLALGAAFGSVQEA